MSELEQRIPTVVLEVRINGRPNSSATVFIDGRRLAQWTRGEALRLDPGEHTFRFELPSRQAATQTVTLSEGTRFYPVSVEFETPGSGAPATKPGAGGEPKAGGEARTERPTPVIVYPLLGVGVLGLATFGVLALSGKSEQNRLEDDCAPSCTDDDLSTMRKRYLIADVSLGVGLGALAGAGILYLTRPERAVEPSVGLSVLPGGIAAFGTHHF